MMFKKSNRNRNLQLKKTGSDSDDEKNGNQVSTSAAAAVDNNDGDIVVSKKSVSTAATVLSFDMEEEQNESNEFRIKKSKESRRIAKEMKKAIKRESKDQVLMFSSSSSATVVQKSTVRHSYKMSDSDEDALKERSKENEPEESSDEDNEENEKDKKEDEIQRLREEMEDLGGGSDAESLDQETDETKRSMKLMLKSGLIPDAEMIHAARKKREMARLGDFVPIGPEANKQREEKGRTRFIREDDEHDLSEDESGQVSNSRVSLNYRDKAHRERQQTRDNFLAYEQGSDEEKEEKSDENEDEEDEEDQWEKEQIRKGVQISQHLPSKFKVETSKGGAHGYRTVDLSKILGSNVEPEPMDIEPPKQFDLEKLKNLPSITFQGVKQLLHKNLESLDETHRAHNNEVDLVASNLKASQSALERITQMRPIIDQEYIFYQEMSAFVQDLIECFNEKLVEIENAENQWLNLHAERAEKVIKRRNEELNDQHIECLGTKPIDDTHLRRISEREERRQKRRAQRQQQRSIDHNDGFSTNDEETPDDTALFEQRKSEIVSNLYKTLFEEVNEDFHKIDLIKQRFEKWKAISPDAYKEAYVALSLPKLFSPLIRLELVDWNVLEDPVSLEKLSWFNELVKYNEAALLQTLQVQDTKQTNLQQKLDQLKHDDDFLIIPHIVEKTVLNKLISIAEKVYDPLSARQTKNFASFIKSLIHSYPTLNSQSANTKKLIDTLIARIRKTLDQEVFIPLFQKTLIDVKTSKHSIFFYRQFWSAFKLFENILQWHGVLSNRVLKELSMDALLNRYLMTGLYAMDCDMSTVAVIDSIIKKIPEDLVTSEATGNSSIPQLANLCRTLRRIVDTIHQKEVETKQMDSRQFRDIVKQVRKIFTSIQAMDQATSLSNTYDSK